MYAPGKAVKELTAFYSGRAYWKMKRRDGTWLSALDEHVILKSGVKREIQWYDDVVANGDVLQARELWLYCPRHTGYPKGRTVMLPIMEAGTAFAHFGAAATGNVGRYQTYVAIGRVIDKVGGIYESVVWDYLVKQMFAIRGCIYEDFGRWRPGCSPVGLLSHDVIGLRLE